MMEGLLGKKKKTNTIFQGARNKPWVQSLPTAWSVTQPRQQQFQAGGSRVGRGGWHLPQAG
jgi:hypothetical protein